MTKTDSKGFFLPMAIISALFFIFGFVTWLNGILIPYLQIACELTDFQALMVAFSFYIAYTIMALPSAMILKKTGFKNGMMLGLFIMAVGTMVFIPAASTRAYWVFLVGLFIMGTGLALLQTASNPYITLLGPKESAARRISILGICNKAAGGIAPLILAYYILNDGDAFVESLKGMSVDQVSLALDDLARRVINPYIVMTIVLVIMGIGLRLSPLPTPKIAEESESKKDGTASRSIFSFPFLILGAMALFFYVGAEVIAGDTIIRYGISLGIKIDVAKAFTTYTMLAMIVGYILGIILIPKYITQQFALKVSAILGIIFSIAAVFSNGMLSVIFIALLGLANAIVWPAIWPLAISNLGSKINTGSALLIMAISGGAILPLVWGKLSDTIGSQNAYWILLPLYAFIFFYAQKGHKINSWKKK
jgi:MFS transporter, FHS family, L-fucose permease